MLVNTNFSGLNHFHDGLSELAQNLTPEAERVKRKALQKLLSLQPTPAPEIYGDWKHQYGGLKTNIKKDKA